MKNGDNNHYTNVQMFRASKMFLMSKLIFQQYYSNHSPTILQKSFLYADVVLKKHLFFIMINVENSCAV